MSSTSTGQSQAPPKAGASGDGATFSGESEPTDDAPTIISKTHPTVAPQAGTAELISVAGPQSGLPAGLANGLRGRRLAHFELIEAIGVGGMAAVLRALDTQLDRQVALKILPPEMSADVESVRRFHQEAKAAARLDHENIARVFFCGEEQGLHFIAFEYVEGDNLRTLLDRRGRLPVAEAVRYVLQIATGLEHAAARGVVHRDVKPSNIIISPNGRAKLVDMGLARNTERHGEADLTHSGVTLGTFDYISPEQAMEPRDADARSDIYSLGCTFYHMLTGEPPVPEGTAAKKLHHHQHVAPVDPRQLVPDIPDDIALILGRMMAKDPRTRYQRPLQLVQHLLQVARKVGAADDLPEGVLFVDTPLPTAPRSRPLLVVSLAMLALGTVVALLALAPEEGQVGPLRPEFPQAEASGSNTKRIAAPVTGMSNPTVRPEIAGANAVIRTPGELGRAARDPEFKNRTSIKLSGRIDLTEIPGGLTLNAGPALVIESDVPNDVAKPEPATLVFRAGSAAHADALILAGGKVTFKNLKIEIGTEGGYPRTSAAAVAVRGAEKVIFSKCIFEQKGVPPISSAHSSVASVLVDSGALPSVSAQPNVEFRECYFTGNAGSDALYPERAPGGQVAIAVNGPAQITAVDCGFKPHGAFFQLRDQCRVGSTDVNLDHCSGFVLSGPVFRFEPRASAKLHATRCLFSRGYDNTVVYGSEPDLIRQPAHSDNEAIPIRFHGKDNCYHHLNALWSVGPSLKNTLEQFRKALREQDAGDDVGSIDPPLPEEQSPWHLMPDGLRVAVPQTAFQVKSEYAGYGLRAGYWGELAQPAIDEPPLPAKVKLLDPDFTGKRANVFTSFERALANMDPGETLLVKARKDGREIELPPTWLKVGVDLVVKAFGKTTPVFALGNAAVKKDVAFFRLLEGRLRFEGVHFLLEPRQDGAGSQSLLLLGDNAQCTFEHCVVTLKATRSVPLSVVAFVDPKELMRTEQPRPNNTSVQMSNSFVRGDGDLVTLTSCRQLKLALENSLFALGGSMLSIQAGSEDVPADQSVQVEMKKVSAFAREPLFSLRTFKSGKGLTRTYIDARSCLLGALADRALVYVEANDVVSEDQLARYLDWKGELNCYANFGRLLEHERPNEMGSAMQLEPGRWEKLFTEQRPRHEKVLAFPASGELKLSEATPNLFRPTDADPLLAQFGAARDLDAIVKVPAAK